MKTKRSRCLCAIGCVLALCMSTASAVTCEVYRLTTSLNATVQLEEGALEKMKVSHNHLINLGLGRGTDHLVSSNEVLGIALEAEHGYIDRIIVYDTNTHSNLATLATAFDGAVVVTPKGGTQFMVLLDAQDTGGVSNSMHGGEIMLTGTQSPPGPRGSKISATIDGFLHIEITDDVGHHHSEALFSKGKVTFGNYVGDLYIP